MSDEIWHQKTRIVVLPDSEEIVLTEYRRVTDRRTRCSRTDPRVKIIVYLLTPKPDTRRKT